MVGRHQSDVTWGIDSQGNAQIRHPSGAYIRIGESPDSAPVDGTNADGNAKIDRNTGRKVNVRIGLAGNAVVVTMAPDGTVTMVMEKDFILDAKGAISMKAKGNISMETEGEFTVKAKGDAKIDGANVRLNEG